MAPKPTNKGTSKSNEDTHNEEPHILARVLRAIADMKQDRGCTTCMIIEHLNSVKTSPKNITKDRLVVEVRRALHHAVYTGLLEKRVGRYVLASKGTKGGESNKRKTGRGKNPQGGKRRRSPSNSPSRSTEDEQSDSTDRSRSRSSNKDDSSPDRSQKRTRKHKRKEETRNKRKNKRQRSRSARSNRSRSRNDQKKTDSEPPDNPSNENRNKQEQQQTDRESLPRVYNNCRRQKHIKPYNRGTRNQQMDEGEGNNRDVDENSEGGNPECLNTVKQDQRERSLDSHSEPDLNVPYNE